MIELDHTVTPSPTNALGVKGVGEAGTIAAPPAVINAVVDALSHLASPTSTCRPRQSGLAAIQEGRSSDPAPSSTTTPRNPSTTPSSCSARTGGRQAPGRRALAAPAHEAAPGARRRCSSTSAGSGPGRRPRRRRPLVVGALTRHADLERRACQAALPDPGPRRRPGGRPPGPPPRDHRRVVRARRPGVGPADGAAGPRRRRSSPRARAATRQIAAADFFKGFLETASEAERALDGDPHPQDRRGRLELHQVPPAGTRLGHGGRRRPSSTVGRRSRSPTWGTPPSARAQARPRSQAVE